MTQQQGAKDAFGRSEGMTALKLDNRQPVIVIVGDFNPAIFNPMWIARNLHGYKEGAEVTVLEILADVGGSVVAHLSFIDGVAIAVNTGRLDAFVLDQEEQTVATLERVLTNVIVSLPHTPLRAMGCNLTFSDDDPSDQLLALFDSPEGLEGEFVARARHFGAQLEVGDAILNFNRTNANGVVQFRFNFHRVMSDAGAIRARIQGLLRESRDASVNLLASLYGLKDYESIGFQPSEAVEAEEDGHGEAAAERAFVEEHGHKG